MRISDWSSDVCSSDLRLRLVLLRLLRARPHRHQAGLPEELRDPVGRLGADLQPMLEPLVVQRDPLRMIPRDHRVVSADLFDEPAAARAVRLGDHEAIEWALLLPGPVENDPPRHAFLVPIWTI